MSKLEEVLAKEAEKGIAAAEKAGEFVMEQAPELVQEFLRWHTVKHAGGAALWFIILGICVWGVRWVSKHSDKELEADTEPLTLTLFFSAIGGAGAVAGFVYNAYQLLYILMAPKLYVIEYFVNALK
jgi:TRAP-type C4-dicarboxylate transport system permease small subunit